MPIQESSSKVISSDIESIGSGQGADTSAAGSVRGFESVQASPEESTQADGQQQSSYLGSLVDSSIAGFGMKAQPARTQSAASTVSVKDSDIGKTASSLGSIASASTTQPNRPSDNLTPSAGSQVSATSSSAASTQNDSSSSALVNLAINDSGLLRPNNETNSQGSDEQQQQQTSPVSEVRQAPEASQTDDAIKEKRNRYVESIKRQQIREAGIVEKPEPVNFVSRANRRFAASKKALQEKIKGILSGKSYSGDSFMETIVSDRNVFPHCVSIGSENLLESIREPNSTIIDLVNEKLREAGSSIQLDRESCLFDISQLVDAINSINMEVVLEKTPVNIANSVQVRTLRAHYGRGLRLHPSQTKAYNADFDGDSGFLNFDKTNLNKFNRAMSYLIDAEGNPMIDSDFFPVDFIEYDRDLVDDILFCLRYKYFSWNPSAVDLIKDAYFDLCRQPDENKSEVDYWRDFLRAVDNAAVRLSTTSNMSKNELSSYVLKSIYDFSTNRRGLSVRSQLEHDPSVHDAYERMDENTDPFVGNLIDLYAEISAGRPAMNFVEFNAFYNKYYGDVKGRKNVPFRLLADFAKAINRTDLIAIGDGIWGTNFKDALRSSSELNIRGVNEESEVTINQLWEFTCAAAMSKRIKGQTKLGSRTLAVSTQVRSMVLREVGLPNINENSSSEDQYKQWLERFVESYNFNMRMLNIAQIGFRGGMIPTREKVGRFDGVKDDWSNIDKALVEVFGDFTVGRVFPTISFRNTRNYKYENTDNYISDKYQDMPLSLFSVNNRLVFKSEAKGSARMTDVDRRIANGSYSSMDIILKVADRRSSQFGDFKKEWEKATEKHSKIMVHIADSINKREFNDYVNDMLELLHLVSPDMFDYFGMDSPITFAQSKWGKALVNAAGNVDQFRSTLVSMMVEYRLARASSLLTSLIEVDDSALDSEAQDVRRRNIESVFYNEMQTLASSSDVWDSIVKEFRTDSSETFAYLFNEVGRRGQIGNWSTVYAKSFWMNGENASKYSSILDFLKSDESYETKINVLTDFTRVKQGYPYISPNEVLGQLASHPDRLHAGNRFDSDSGISSDIKTIKESIDKISSYMSKAPSKIKKEGAKFVREAKKDKLKFEKRLARFASDPGYFIHVDPVLAADAIASIFDKTYADSEKIKQQTFVNGYFEALSLQRNGGFYTHLQQTDNAVVNVIGFDQVSAVDLIRVLGDPSISFIVYDEFGTPAVMSRETLCGGKAIDDVISFLERNPRLSMSCRRFIAGVQDNENGSGKINAMNNLEAGDTVVDRVFSLVNDRPRFLAIAALVTPSSQNVGRNLSEQIADNLDNLCKLLFSIASNNPSTEEAIEKIEEYTGITEDAISKFSNLEDEAVENLYQETVDELLSCVSLVQQSMEDVAGQFDGEIKKMSIDEISVISYYDARQQLSGARTAKMIGIEGSETKKNLILKEYLKHRPDRFMTVRATDPASDILKLSELTQSDIQAELDRSEDGSIVIEVPAGWTPSDLTTEDNPNKQKGSICKFLEVKREKGAETYNAKTKKYGDDGTNSIIKFFKFATRAMLYRFGKTDAWSIEDGRELVDKIRACSSKDEAIPILANALIEADRRLGYTDDAVFIKSDYWNRADLMLADDLSIRTLEQLSVALRNRLSDAAMVSEDTDAIIAEMNNIVATVGTTIDSWPSSEQNVLHSVTYGIPINSSIGNKYHVDRALRSRSSSVERNYLLLYRLFKQAMVRDIPSRKTIELISSKMIHELSDEMSSKLKGIAYPRDKWVNGEMKEQPFGSREYIYDYIGRPQDDGFVFIPGPQSLVLFDGLTPAGSFQDNLERCRSYGITATFDGEALANLPQELSADLIEVDEGLFILPFFDMMLNGAASDPIAPAPSEIPFNRENAVVCVESTTYEFGEGDATFHITKELGNRIKFFFNGSKRLSVYDLFPNVINSFPDSRIQLQLCDRAEVERYIVNSEFVVDKTGVHLKSSFGDAVLDIGVGVDHPNFEREAERVRLRLLEYSKQFGSAGDDSILSNDCRYDSIIGFVKVKIDNNNYAFAPIIPFHLEESGMVPTTFKASIDIDFDSGSYVVDWNYTGSILGQYIKFFEGIGSSNKMITSSDFVKSRTLANGLSIDGFYSTKSVASRLFASNKRIQTLISMMMIPRLDSNYAYNFAELADAFPGESEAAQKAKQGLLDGTLNFMDWVDIRNNVKTFHNDPEIDAVVKSLVDKCLDYGTVNPSTLLSTKTSQGISWPKYTEFEAFFESGYNFQNSLMKLMNAMQPTLVPSNIDGDSSNTLFKPVTKDRSEEDYGVLQMMVPCFDDMGRQYSALQNVYISFGFFGEEFSGFKKVNINAYNRALDSLNVANNVNQFELSQILAFGRSGMTSVPASNTIEAAPDKDIRRVAPNERF